MTLRLASFFALTLLMAALSGCVPNQINEHTTNEAQMVPTNQVDMNGGASKNAESLYPYSKGATSEVSPGKH